MTFSRYNNCLKLKINEFAEKCTVNFTTEDDILKDIKWFIKSNKSEKELFVEIQKEVKTSDLKH